MSKRLFTSESVTEGHPDKIADQISDAILDSLIGQDKKSRVAAETLITTGQVHVAGEVTTDAYADVMGIVRETVLNIGYDSSDKGFDGNTCGVSVSIGQQSQDIAQGVDDAYENRVSSSVDPLDLQGAGDQDLCLVTPAMTLKNSCLCLSGWRMNLLNSFQKFAKMDLFHICVQMERLKSLLNTMAIKQLRSTLLSFPVSMQKM